MEASEIGNEQSNLATSALQSFPPAAPLLWHSQWPKLPSGFLTAESLHSQICMSPGTSPGAHFSLAGFLKSQVGTS